MSVLAQSRAHMRAQSMIASAHDLLDRLPLSAVQLAARLAVAGVFWRSGQTKIASWDLTIELFRNEYQVPLLPPELAATLATGFELGCSLLLLIGLATRFAALPLLGMTIVIQTFVYPENWPEHLTWAALLLLLVLRGGGAFSIDQLVGSIFSRHR